MSLKWYSAILIGQYPVQSSSGKLPPPVDRGPHPDVMQRVKHSSLNGMPASNPCLESSGNLREEEVERVQDPEKIGNTKKIKPSKSTRAELR